MGWLVANIVVPIVEWLLAIGLKDAVDYWNKQKAQAAQKAANDLAVAEYKKIIADPNASEQERKDAENKLLNS